MKPAKPCAKVAKTGAKWPGNAPSDLLSACLPYRKWLRIQPSVPVPAWVSVAEALKSKGYGYSWAQVKEKMRNIKRTFQEAKQGQHGGDHWMHFWLLTYIYDDPIAAGDVTLAEGTC